ncbi:MAG: type-F conjugative transfer system protein TraW [Alphaproteobacteria bacterium]|nr:type-F conjugative transfer system protein TraW [Alphaproteobacteria bacterium]
MVVRISSLIQVLFLLLCLGSPIALQAKDFGVRGKIAPIEEDDPLVLIQSKLKTMEERGELERHNRELQKKTRAAIERPKPVEGITRTTKAREFHYDPTYVVQEDLKDHQGRTIYSKGTRLNPLETVTFSQELLFFDGDDEDQIAFAKEKLKEKPKEKLAESSVKLILVKGAPIALSEELKVPVYFDQSGLLTKKLGIYHVPAFVTQEGMRLRIEEIKKEEDR